MNEKDIYLAFIAGLVGYVLHRYGFPLAPMVLALILGPLADENFRQALKIFSEKDLTSMVTAHPIGTVLIFIVIYTFYDGIFKRGRGG